MKKLSSKPVCIATILFAFLMITVFQSVCHAKAANTEVQADYLMHRIYARRFIDNYNLHIFQKVHEHAGLTFHRGLTVTRAHGYTTEDDIRRNSNAVGLGPAGMIRWERPISGKLYGDLEFSGSFLIYNKSFPAQGRPWGFMWRIGPRLTWKYTKDNSISLGYMFSHSSNGMRTKNPGHHAFGFSLGFNHSF
ncbi:MAG: acyloxyacyl hydrolase [Acidaminococcaceae bacterium]|nr:acyloxyacyl hydrolase [Acidaminococcaceae bacterium]